jgi:hypothetical protein
VTWHWYVPRENEIFLDHDSDRDVSFAMHKLELNCPGKLEVKAVYHYPSGTPGHSHMVLVLKRPMLWIERIAWSLHLRSDIRRAQIILMRKSRGGCAAPEADFLITPKPYSFRKPDHVCRCAAKHKEQAITEHCPVLRDLLRNERCAEYFALEPERRIYRLGVGRVRLFCSVRSFQSTRYDNGAKRQQPKQRIAK